MWRKTCFQAVACGWTALAAATIAAAGAPSHAAGEAMSRRADSLLAQRWAEAGVEPAPPASDAEFLRRACLDLGGVIPTASEARAFLADQRPDKRLHLIDSLLASPRHATHLANTWRNLLLPADAQLEQFVETLGFERWLWRRFAGNDRYDTFVADLLTTTGNSQGVGAALFYTAYDLKPDELAASTSRIFLGVQIQCAQCHNHPFDHWTQEDFWAYAAFFARLQRLDARQPSATALVDATLGEVTLPGTDRVVTPKYLGAEPPREDADVNRRRQLAIWMVSRDNRYFPRAAVNRVWAHLFGRGLVHPLDDFAAHNPPSHPELLEELAAYFVETGYDLGGLFRTLAGTQAYQLSSQTASEVDTIPPELFGRMAIKTLTPEQLYDCLVRATRPSAAAGPAAGGPVDPRLLDPGRLEFIARFQSSAANATEFQAGIPQVLLLMNGPWTAQATDPDRSGILLALDAPFFDDRQRVETLFLATLSRLPEEHEASRLIEYVQSGGPARDRRKALGDVLWALLNSPEFILNH